jgi:hypothetical protein
MLYQIDLQQPTTSQRIRIRQPADLNVLEKHIEEFLTSKVYLYHTGQGIIAKGAATAGFRR